MGGGDRDTLAKELVVASQGIDLFDRKDLPGGLPQEVDSGDLAKTELSEVAGGFRFGHTVSQHGHTGVGRGVKDAGCRQLAVIGDKKVLDVLTRIHLVETRCHNLVLGIRVASINQHRNANRFHDGTGLVG